MNKYQTAIIWLGLMMVALNIIVNLPELKTVIFGTPAATPGGQSNTLPPAGGNKPTPPLAPGAPPPVQTPGSVQVTPPPGTTFT